MKRRTFLTTASAAAAIPALPSLPLAKTTPAAISSSARYWAVYMTELNGDITPATLGKMTGLSTQNAAVIKADLIAQNILKPTGFALKSSATKTLDPKATLKRAKKALDTLAGEAEPEAETQNTQ